MLVKDGRQQAEQWLDRYAVGQQKRPMQPRSLTGMSLHTSAMKPSAGANCANNSKGFLKVFKRAYKVSFCNVSAKYY